MSYTARLEQRGLERGLAQGRQEGEAALLIRLLKNRFGNIPEHYIQRIWQASAESLLLWGDQLLKATCIEEVFL